MFPHANCSSVSFFRNPVESTVPVSKLIFIWPPSRLTAVSLKPSVALLPSGRRQPGVGVICTSSSRDQAFTYAPTRPLSAVRLHIRCTIRRPSRRHVHRLRRSTDFAGVFLITQPHRITDAPDCSSVVSYRSRRALSVVGIATP